MIHLLESFVIESEFNKNINTIGFRYGWGNGYAVVHSSHPCYRMDYSLIQSEYDIDVHGGLTYSSSPGKYHIGFIDEKYCTEEYWVVGFDTCHSGDNPNNWPEKRVREEAARLASQLYIIGIYHERQLNREL